MVSSINLPPPSTPAIDLNTGQFYLPWWQSIFALVNRTGGQDGLNLEVVNQRATDALILATTANARSLANQSAITAVTITAGNALVTANNAQTLASSAITSVSNALLKNANLLDVTSVATSRVNLGVATTQVSFMFDGMPSSSQKKYIPLVRGYTVPLNFGGTKTWAGTVPFADTVFTLKLIRSGITTTIGTITLIHAGNFSTLSGSITALIAGDILEIEAPAVPDVNLANVSFGIALTLT